MVKLDRYPMRACRNTFVVGRCRAAFLYSAKLFRAGTLDGVALISNSFLVQSPAESGLIVAVSLFKPRRIKDLVVAAITELHCRYALRAAI